MTDLTGCGFESISRTDQTRPRIINGFWNNLLYILNIYQSRILVFSIV
jgi:hypothetical protein